MRLSLFAHLMLLGIISEASVKAQICRVYSAQYFRDSSCSRLSVEQPDARKIAEYDNLVRNGATCQQAEPNAPLKMSVICNSDGSVQKNYYNLAKEDENCLNAYGQGSVIPSIVIRDGACFEYIPGKFMKWAMNTNTAANFQSQGFYTYNGQQYAQAYQNAEYVDEAESLTTGAIVGIIIGSVFLLLIALAFCMLMVRQANKNQSTIGAPTPYGNTPMYGYPNPQSPYMQQKMPQSPMRSPQRSPHR